MELILELRELLAAVRAVAEIGTKEAWLRAVKLSLGILMKITEALESPPIRDTATFAGEPRTLVQLCDDLEKECALAEGPAPARAGNGLWLALLPIVFEILKRLLAR